LNQKIRVQRFSLLQRLFHLLLIVTFLTQGATGLARMFIERPWGQTLAWVFGGYDACRAIHIYVGIIMLFGFGLHCLYLLFNINWRNFPGSLFGPDSLLLTPKDIKDFFQHIGWFFGITKPPQFDRWGYWEKFDYWAPFWGMTIIGVSGLLMWYPIPAAAFLPGWAFNVASIVHGEEAFLAAVFLFTVHFFNNHFRPDKFPQDTTMFTGRVPLAIYKHEHRREYERLLASGELDKYLVDAPTEPQSAAASLLGATLITFGLFLLTLVILGFFGV